MGDFENLAVSTRFLVCLSLIIFVCGQAEHTTLNIDEKLENMSVEEGSYHYFKFTVKEEDGFDGISDLVIEANPPEDDLLANPNIFISTVSQ